MDIIGAMNKEREYLSFRAKGEVPYYLVDAVKEYGFNTLDDFFNAKKDYLFTQLDMKVVMTTAPKAIKTVQNIVTEGELAMIFALTESTLVWNGNGGDADEDYCKECNISIYPYMTGGGTIVSTAGDLNLGICVPNNLKMDMQYFLNRFARLFRQYTNKTVVVKGNDVIVDGNKIMGGASYEGSNVFMFLTSISLSDKTDLINCICRKHSTKQPGHVDFIDADKLMVEVKKWLKTE